MLKNQSTFNISIPVWVCMYSLIMFRKAEEKLFLDWGVSLMPGKGNSSWIALKSKFRLVPYKNVLYPPLKYLIPSGDGLEVLGKEV